MDNNAQNESGIKKNDTKTLIIFVIVIGLLLTGICGYIVYDKFFNNHESNNELDNTNLNDNVVEPTDEEYIKNKIYADKPFAFIKEEKIFYEDEDYTIKTFLPVINLNNQKAKELNKRLEELYNYSKTSSGDSTLVLRFEEYINGDILSFVLYEDYYEGGDIEAFNFNLKTNKEVTFDEILVIKKISLSDFKTKVNKALDKHFNDHKEMYDYMEHTNLEKDLETAKNSVDYSKLNIFLNQNNNIAAIINVHGEMNPYESPSIFEIK